MISFNSIKSIHVLWAEDEHTYLYAALPESINGNEQAQSIRFKLRAVVGESDDLEIVIQRKTDSAYIFKTDFYKDPEHEYSLKAFVADDELLLYFGEKDGPAYFHLRSNE